MSRYSGKCDLCDSIWSSVKTEEEAFNKFNGTALYICQPLPDDFDWMEAAANNVSIPETYYKKVEYSSLKDVIPFYPYTVACAYYDNKDAHNSIVCLSSESFVDREERESLEFNLKHLVRIYNRCKRKKMEFNVDDAIKEVTWNGWNEEPYRELANRVAKNGKKATVDGIHLNMHEWYRKELVDEMLRNGLDPCQYGDYERFIEKGVRNESIKEQL